MTELLETVPRWVTNLAFWIALLTLIATAWGVLRSIKGMRADLDKAVDDVYDLLDELKAEQQTPVPPLSAPLRAAANVVDIPTTRTAVARTDEAVEGLKAVAGMPTDPNKLTAIHTVTTVPTAAGLDTAVPNRPTPDVPPTNEIPALHPDDPGRLASNVTDTGWAYVLHPDYHLEQVDGHTIPAFRHPEHPTTNPLQLHGATRLDLAHTGGRHRHPEDDA